MLKKTITLAYIDEASKKTVNLEDSYPIFDEKTFVPNDESQSNLFLAGLTLGFLTVLTVAVNKCKRSKDGF